MGELSVKQLGIFDCTLAIIIAHSLHWTKQYTLQALYLVYLDDNSDYGPIVTISGLARSALMKQITVDSSIKKLSTEVLTMQISRAELPLASFCLY